MVQRVVARHADMAFEHVFFVFLRSWSQGFNVGDGITYVPGTGSDSCFDWKRPPQKRRTDGLHPDI